MDNILDECLERVVFHGEKMEDVLKSHPDCAAELEPLLKTALAVKHATAISPREEFRARARYEFHQALTAGKSEKHGFFNNFMPRWAAALSVAMAAILATGGTVAAASNSMPDSVLYPVKLATEQARMTVTLSEESKAELYAEYTDKRVEEIVYMANRGDADKVVVLARKLDDRTGELAAMTEAANAKGEPVLVQEVPNQAPSIQSVPEAAKAVLPAASQPPMLAAGAPPTDAASGTGTGGTGPVTGGGVTGSTGTAEVRGAIPGTPAPTGIRPFVIPGPETSVNDSKTDNTRSAVSDRNNLATNNANKEKKLKVMLSDYAVKHPAKLREALDKLPEPARNEILRSIAVTAANYDKALRSFEER